ncbi:MAG: hypothetical protein RLZZ140_769, partial [Pseudomonadota bacterium]
MRLDHTTLPKFLTQELEGSADARNLAAL